MPIEYEVPETGRERVRRYVRDYVLPIGVEASRYAGDYLYRELENSLADLVSVGVKRTFSGAVKTPPPRYSQLTSSQASGGSVRPRKMPRFTTGYFGRRFSKRGRSKSTKFAVSYKNEVAGTVTNANTCYIGHGPAYVTVLRMLCMALYERLRKKHGAPVLDWLDGCSINGVILMNRLDGNQTASSATGDTVATFGISDTHNAVVGQIINYFYTKYRDGEPDDTERNFEALNIGLYTLDDDGIVTVNNQSASINLQNTMISIKMYSYLNMQNSTLGAGIGDTEADDVTNNPLVGRSYTGHGNGWRWKRVIMTAAGNWAPTAHRDNGQIFIQAANMGAQLTDILVRPPDKNMLANVKKVGTARLAPGEMRGDRISQTVKVYVNTLLYKLRHPMKERTIGTTSASMFYMFSYRMFAFEKQMRSGQAATVQYELDQIYRASLHEKRSYLPAIQNIAVDANQP